jgi:hypothetical protein
VLNCVMTMAIALSNLVEYRGQLVYGDVLRSFLFMRRVRLYTSRGYFLVWIPKWKVFS